MTKVDNHTRVSHISLHALQSIVTLLSIVSLFPWVTRTTLLPRITRQTFLSLKGMVTRFSQEMLYMKQVRAEHEYKLAFGPTLPIGPMIPFGPTTPCGPPKPCLEDETQSINTCIHKLSHKTQGCICIGTPCLQLVPHLLLGQGDLCHPCLPPFLVDPLGLDYPSLPTRNRTSASCFGKKS